MVARHWKIAMHPNSQEKMVFVMHERVDDIEVMLFDLTNAPAAFMCFMK